MEILFVKNQSFGLIMTIFRSLRGSYGHCDFTTELGIGNIIKKI